MSNNRFNTEGRAKLISLKAASVLLLSFAGLAGNAAYASNVRISAKAAFKAGNLTYSGKLAPARGQLLLPGTQVSIYDAATGQLVHSTTIDPKNAFKYTLPMDAPMCNLKITAGTTVGFLKVAGAPRTCSTVPSCALTASATSTETGQPLMFTGRSLFSGRTAPELNFDFGNGETQAVTGTRIKGGLQASAPQSFSQANSYEVSFSAKLGNQECRDSIVVSVGSSSAPPAPSEATVDPGNASGMVGDYAVIPFSDRGDVGTANVAANQYQQTQALNAIVYQKEPKKPVALGMNQATVEYSAASNPQDPVGPDSINTTSQNYFAADGTAGANFDASAPNAHARPIPNNATVLLEEKNYTDDFNGVKKSGLWDRMLNRNNNGGSDMTRLTSNPATQVTRLDEGARATKDLMANTQSMPGQADPYNANDPQPFKAFDDDFSFFAAQMLPIVGIDDKGRKNPFPLMRVEAKVDGQSVAKADGAVVTSTEMSCAQCHTKGERSADDNQWFTPVGMDDPEAKGVAAPNNATTHDPSGNSGSSYHPAARPKGPDDYQYPAIQNRFELRVVTENPLVYQMVNPFVTAAANLRTDNQLALYKPFKVWADHVPGTDVNTTGNVAFNSEITNEQMILRGDRIKDYQIVNNKLQIQLNFKAPENNSPQAREQAALFNMLLLHDYYDSFGNTEPGINNATGQPNPRQFSTQFADGFEDKTATNVATPPSCGGHHFSTSNHEVGRGSNYDARFVYTNYSRTMHAFHGRIQVYKESVSAGESADGLAHSKGEVIRDKRGHHIPFGGAGWDPEKKNNYKTRAPGSYDGKSDDFDADAFPMHSKGELMLPFDLKRDPNGNMVRQGLTANIGKTDMAENCSVCHAGKTEKVYHDMHYSAGLTCESCHGDMQAVGALWLRPGKNFTNHKAHNFRKFEYDQPDCGSCHFGSHPNAGRLAFAAWDKSQTSLAVGKTNGANNIDQRFAVQPAEVSIKRTATRTDKLCLGIANETCVDTLLNNSANGEQSVTVGTPLFRKSIDTHGNVPCAACHGPAHTIWPVADKNGNANVTAKQLQGYDGTLMECDACHSKETDGRNSFADGMLASDKAIAYGERGTLVTPAASNAYLAGPHGMHPINDENWYMHAIGAAPSAKPKKIRGVELNGGWHNDMAKKPGPNGEDQCAACHGDDHKGTRLSRTLVDRTFVRENGRQVKVKAGQIIGCGLCHSLKKSFTGAPNPRAINGGWPKPPVTPLPVNLIPKPAETGDIDTAADPANPS
jgi:hypothetical protein